MGGVIDVDPDWLQINAKAEGIVLPNVLPHFRILETAYLAELGKKKTR